MGISGRRAMVLLSTLAALVILVHSHEEEMESYRELGPSLPQSHANNMDQTWRAVRSEPIAQTEEWDKNSPEEAPRRRRLGRKRKRRPLAAIENEPEERRFYHEEPLRPEDHEYQNAFENPDMPRRRRKRPEIRNNNWADQPPEQERPLRRRGQRRKRPVRPKQDDPEVSHPDEKLLDIEDRPFTEEKAASFINHKYDENDETYKKPNNKPNNEELVYDLNPEVENKEVFVETEKPVEVRLPEIVEEKSISDVSKEIDDIKTGPGPIRPNTLKDILKKSNGSSLSEILQQHNLSLSDLLHGKENAISLLKTDDLVEKFKEQKDNDQPNTFKLTESEVDNEKTKITQPVTTEPSMIKQNETLAFNSDELEKEKTTTTRTPEILHVNEDKPKMVHRRRYSPGGRRRLRLKTPMRNGTIKFPGNREYLSANARRLLHQSNFAIRFNATIGTSEANTISTVNDNTIATVETTTVTIFPDETTTQENVEDKITQNIATTVTDQPLSTTVNYVKDDDTKATTDEFTTTLENNETETIEPATETIYFTSTEKVVTTPISKSKQLTNSELRRQALTNRLKKKRLKQKTLLSSTTEASIDNLTKDLFGMSNLVSASEFIARVQSPKTTKPQVDLETTLEDFMATEASSTSRRTSHLPSSRITAATSPILTSTTEEIAKFEIEEILNDTNTGARLSKILIERNMTVDELVEHRERGSSNIHLADIFHNTSREPNPGEPFLSKSSIEPISRETYPLRALLEANSHDLKPTTIEPDFVETRYPNIPVVMDFGSNVNENGENLGIVSLFNKMAGDIGHKVESKLIKKDSEGTPYISTVISVNITNSSDSNLREGRHFEDRHGTVTLNDIISMMHMNYTQSESKGTTKAIPLPATTTSKIATDDSDGMMLMENLQNLQDSNIAPESEEKVELNLLRKQSTHSVEPGILDKIPSHTKSVTVATASILGLSMVVFLLTYATFKWRQQRSMLRKKDSFCENKIPSPVFESRKGTRNQSSTRSMSPMISSNNIYTMSTLDSLNGKESPEYMWDSLRKPFQ